MKLLQQLEEQSRVSTKSSESSLSGICEIYAVQETVCSSRYLVPTMSKFYVVLESGVPNKQVCCFNVINVITQGDG